MLKTMIDFYVAEKYQNIKNSILKCVVSFGTFKFYLDSFNIVLFFSPRISCYSDASWVRITDILINYLFFKLVWHTLIQQ